MIILHAHGAGGHGAHFFEEVILHGVMDTLRIIPFLFLTYLLMEFIEHRAADKAERFMRRAGKFAPLVGGALGAVPQCGFSAAAAGLYAGRVIGVGTLIAVFLSTSDEMLPILLSGDLPKHTVLLMVAYKAGVGMLVGVAIDLMLRIIHREKEPIDIDVICEKDNCHCEKGILLSALHHTLTITLFVFAVTVGINLLVFFVGTEALSSALHGIPIISHLLSAVVGLIPNCAVSVLLATLASDGIISMGTMLAGLFSGAGVGILVLFRLNRHLKQNLLIIAVLVVVAVVFGALGDLIFVL